VSAVCPVSGETFVVTAETPIIERNGRFFAFCCDDCAMDFTSNPGKYDH
jgi:YHS domain-containing protein